MFKKSDGPKRSASIGLYESLEKKFPVTSIEDGCAENDWGLGKADGAARGKVQLVGNDLFVGNVDFLRKGSSKAWPIPSS